MGKTWYNFQFERLAHIARLVAMTATTLLIKKNLFDNWKTMSRITLMNEKYIRNMLTSKYDVSPKSGGIRVECNKVNKEAFPSYSKY